MVKEAYRRFFLNKVWLYLVLVVLVSIFLYTYVSSLGVSGETVNLLVFVILLLGGLPALLGLLNMFGAFFKILAFTRELKRFPEFIRERLEYDFQAGDQIGDLYFTNSHLLVFQVRGGRGQGMACIPYREIQEVRVAPRYANGVFLEILLENGYSHYVYFPSGVKPGTVPAIGEKISGLLSRMESLERVPQEVRKAEKREAQREERKKLSSMGGIFMILDFGAIMGFCGAVMYAEQCRERLYLAESAGYFLEMSQRGRLLFFPNLLFYIAMIGGPLLLLVSLLAFLRRWGGEKDAWSLEWKTRWKLVAFTVLVVLFLLFMGSMYASDVEAWRSLKEGFFLLFGGMAS